MEKIAELGDGIPEELVNLTTQPPREKPVEEPAKNGGGARGV